VTIRPGARWRRLFAKAQEKPAEVDYALSTVHEKVDPEEGGADIRFQGFDPISPQEEDVWVRTDKEPRELRVYSGGRTWAASLAAVSAEPPQPLIPDISLAPPLIPEPVAVFTPLVPDVDLVPPLRPEGV
jgi:hypothetical protein